jgi:hypothetical protein
MTSTPEPREGMLVCDPKFPCDRWRVGGLATDGRIEAERVQPPDGMKTSWSPESWARAWEKGYLTSSPSTERERVLEHYLRYLATDISILSSSDARRMCGLARQGLAEAGCEVPPLPGGIFQDVNGQLVNGTPHA